MSLRLIFQAGVRDEIDDAYAWYERRRQGLGEDFLAALQMVFDRIGQAPEVHAPIYQTIRHCQVKRFPYAVYYRVELDRIAVIAVHHGNRDPQTWQSRA